MKQSKLSDTGEKHVLELMSWFTGAQDIARWGGPDFRFPFTVKSFEADLKRTELASYSLLSRAGQLQAFGQYYLRLGHCHLARLVVNPALRGQGRGLDLVESLSRQGCAALGVESCSLFVLAANSEAQGLYRKCGFIDTVYPETIAMENCLYMVKPSVS